MAEYWALLDQEAQKQCYSDNKIEFAKGQRGITRYPVAKVLAGSIVPDGMEIGHRFEAATPDEADVYFKRLVANGLPQDRSVVGNTGSTGSAATIWRHRGFPHYLLDRLRAFALHNRILMKEIQDHPPLRRISSTLGDLTQLYHSRQKVEGVAQLVETEKKQTAAALANVERYCTYLGVQAAASCQMLDEAYRALGIEHSRPFTVIATPEPSPTTTVTTHDPFGAPEPSGNNVAATESAGRRQKAVAK